MRRLVAALSCAVVLGGCGTGADVGEVMDEVVRVDGGDVGGRVHEDHRLFQGIRYAAAPSGELRWRAPRPAPSWSGVWDATKPGNPCPQVGSSYSDVAATDEDCLFLNVTTPKTATPERPKPVMVWIHGDGAIGAGHYFDGTRLAVDGDVVVVTFNYRMGVFGGFGLPGLADSGTFGLLDQRAALEWVRRNARAFGGDPGNVTVFGVSFGATSASAHLISKGSRGLFHKAILHSGFTLVDVPAGAWYPDLEALPWLSWRPVDEIEGIGAAIAEQLGCSDVDCLRRLPVKRLLEVPQVMNIFQPFGFGGPMLPRVPEQSLVAGQFARVPVLAGATRDEHRSFVGLFRELAGKPVTAEQYPRLLAEAFGDKATKIEAEYPLSDFASPALAWATVLTDRVWARATFRQHQLLAARTPVFAYEFADRNAPSDIEFPPTLPPGAHHSGDIGYLFRDAEFAGKLSPEQLVLSDQMIRYWSNFAHRGNPNGADLPRWAPFAARAHVQSLAPGRGGITGVDYAAEHRLAFWKSL